jgi:multiple sugar transport system ATP-binding protein
VASFIGSPTMNLIAGSAGTASASGQFAIKGGSLPLACPAADALLGLRPEHIELVDGAGWRGEVSLVEPTGADTYVVVKTDAGNVTVRTAPQTRAKPGDTVGLHIATPQVSWFDAKSGVRL